MTNKEIYMDFLRQLQQVYNSNEAMVITDWVFESMAGIHRSDIIKNPGQTLPPPIVEQVNHCLSALLLHKPVQYVLGEAWFYKMKLTVNEQVLIPRPETEELVQLVVDNWRSDAGRQPLPGISQGLSTKNQAPQVSHEVSMLDIGTGSGCIAIAVKKNLPNVRMHAIDVSAGALSVAKRNALRQDAAIRFLLVDFLDEKNWEALSVFDLIISNPPYIPLNEKETLGKNVTSFEPHIALFVPDHAPMLFYEKIAAFGEKHLHRNGEIYVEIHEDYAIQAREIFEPSYRVEIRKDIFGKERILVAAKSIPDL